MLSGEHIICFTLRPWHSTWKTDQKVMSRLATANQILYVDPPRSLRAALGDMLHRTPRKRVVERKARSLLVYQEPVFLPAWGRNHPLSGIYNRIVDPLRLGHIRQTAEHHGFRTPILWSYNPLSSGAIGAFGEKLVVYCVLDNYYECFSPGEIWSVVVQATHREMMRRADVVFAVSEALLEQCLEYNRNSYLIPNGVSYELFEAALQNSSPPQDVLPIPRPIIGFVGALHATIDFGLLELLARSYSKWSLMIVGPVETLTAEDKIVFERLCMLPNVHYLGAKRPELLPDYVKCCDVGLIPYRINTFTSFGDPQKLYEYLACGKPVVSTAMPSVRRFSPYVHVADNPTTFASAVAQALAQPDGLSEARKNLAKENSWDRRVGEMSAILRRYMEARRFPKSAVVASKEVDDMQHVLTEGKTAQWQWKVKRVVDVAVAGTALIVLAPAFALIATAIWLTSSGPVLYRWPVVGKGGRPFKAYKFRTMVEGADEFKKDLLHRNEAIGPVFKMRDDPRVTPIGQILRKFSLDELPQLWSVLKGDMSLAGPRPVLDYEWEQMERWQRRKLSTKPGIVCLWHIRGQPRDFNEWVKLDLEYIDNWSLWLDLKLLLWTPLYAISGRNF